MCREGEGRRPERHPGPRGWPGLGEGLDAQAVLQVGRCRSSATTLPPPPLLLLLPSWCLFVHLLAAAERLPCQPDTLLTRLPLLLGLCRLQKLAASHGVDVSNLSDDEDEPMAPAAASSGAAGSRGLNTCCSQHVGNKEAYQAAAGVLTCVQWCLRQCLRGKQATLPALPSACAPGLFEDEEDEEEEAAQPKKRAPKKGGKAGKQQQRKGGKKPARQRKAVQSDEEDWAAGMSGDSGSEESEDEAGSEGSDEAVVAATRAGSRSGRASAGAAAAAKAAALAAAELPFRRRLKKFARAAAAAEAAARSPAGSSGSHPRQQQRPGAKATQSVASSTPASAGPGPLIPKRTSAVTEKDRDRSLLLKRRSEIDRRLEAMVNASGRLR